MGTTSSAHTDAQILSIAQRQHGAATRAQLLDAGVTPKAIEVRLRSGRLRAVHRGVYLVGSLRGPLEPSGARRAAAVLACGPGAVVSHRSAAQMWELLPHRSRAEPVEVTVPGRSQPQRSAIKVHRAKLLASDCTRIEGIPVTSAGRTLRDLAELLSVHDLNCVAARAERWGLVSEEEISSLPARHHGRPGAPVLRAALVGAGRLDFTRSEAEDRFLDLVIDAGLDPPECNVAVSGREVDFLWRAAAVAVEVDGYDFHRSRLSFETDRLRDSEFAAKGITVMRVTWRQITEQPRATLVRLAQTLALRDP